MIATRQTSSFHLRDACAKDASFLERLVSSPLVRRYLGGPVENPVSHVRSVYLENAKEAVWIVTDETEQLVGVVSVGRHRDSGSPEVSYQFDPAVWGQGYASAAVSQVVEQQLARGAPCILAETQVANTASCRLLYKVGFAEHARVQRFGAEQVIFIKQA